MPSPPRKLTETPERQLRSLQSLDALTSGDGAVLTKVFESLQILAPDGSWLAGRCSSLQQLCQIELASGELADLKGRAFDISIEFFAQLFSQRDAFQLSFGSDLKLAIASSVLTERISRGHIVAARIDLPDGEKAIVIQWRKTAIDAEHARAVGMVAELASQALSSSDLSLEVEAQELQSLSLRSEIDESQQFYKQFSDAIRQCFWVLDLKSTRPVVISDNFEKVWGANASILSDGLTGFMSSVFPGDHDRLLAEFHLSLESELDTEFRVIATDGEVRWIWMRAFQTREIDHRLIVIADDITERKAHEELLRNREATMIHHARALAVSDVASGVAHEINNPLAIVVGRAAQIKIALQKTHIDAAAISDLADKIQATSIRICEIVSSLKSLSRHSKNPVFEDTSFERIFTEARDLCNEKFRNGGVVLAIQEFTKSIRAQANPTMVAQLLINLLNNAFDAVSDLPDKWVRVEIYDDAQSVYVSVTDSGSGIPIKNRGRIFDPFFTTKATGKGTGLGLALAAGIAAHHRGAINLDTLNPHTRFVAQFPKVQPK